MTDAVRPEDVLPDDLDHATVDGQQVRKGSVAAFVANAQLLEQLPQQAPESEQIVAQLRALAPSLQAVGVFDVFTPRSPRLARILAES